MPSVFRGYRIFENRNGLNYLFLGLNNRYEKLNFVARQKIYHNKNVLDVDECVQQLSDENSTFLFCISDDGLCFRIFFAGKLFSILCNNGKDLILFIISLRETQPYIEYSNLIQFNKIKYNKAKRGNFVLTNGIVWLIFAFLCGEIGVGKFFVNGFACFTKTSICGFVLFEKKKIAFYKISYYATGFEYEQYDFRLFHQLHAEASDSFGKEHLKIGHIFFRFDLSMAEQALVPNCKNRLQTFLPTWLPEALICERTHFLLWMPWPLMRWTSMAIVPLESMGLWCKYSLKRIGR